MIEELVKYWEEYKKYCNKAALEFQKKQAKLGHLVPTFTNVVTIEGFMDYLSDKLEKDENNS